MMLLTACNGKSDQPAPSVPSASLRVVHASPGAPAVDISVNGSSVKTHLNYGQATDAIIAKSGTISLAVLGRLPGTSRPAVIGPADVALAANGVYAVLAVNNVAAIGPLVVARETSTVASTSVRPQVVHAAPAAPPSRTYSRRQPYLRAIIRFG